MCKPNLIIFTNLTLNSLKKQTKKNQSFPTQKQHQKCQKNLSYHHYPKNMKKLGCYGVELEREAEGLG